MWYGNISLLICIPLLAVSPGQAFARALATVDKEHARPFIWVADADRAAVLEKIETQPWAASVFEKMKTGVDSYVDRHVEDPAWILGRIQLTWSGSNFTGFKKENGELASSGDAPHPTVRFMKGRMPRTAEGHAVAVPDLADVPPFNTHPTGGMMLEDRTTGEKVMVPYIDRYLRDINRRILALAHAGLVLQRNAEDAESGRRCPSCACPCNRHAYGALRRGRSRWCRSRERHLHQ